MASVNEKIQKFLDVFGDKGQEILDQVTRTEKEAIASGVAFKENNAPAEDTPIAETAPAPEEDVTTKAKKPAPAPAPVADEEEAGELEEEVAEGEEAEMPVMEAAPAPKKRAKKEASAPVAEEAPVALDDEPLEDADDIDLSDFGDDELVMGNMTVKEYGDMMAEVMVAAMQPFYERLEEVEQQLGRRKEADSLMLESHLAQSEMQEKLRKQLVDMEASFKELKENFAKLAGDAPKSAAHIASQAPETIVTDESRLKEVSAQKDPLGDFTQFILKP